ncbi:hypothetical protein [Streptosporangium sandarakinum]|uniref:hypothetical protein n=1 Tax=Streptosporangium sandarakinum TaxID=1260955 RepID=UPI00368C0B06
MSSGDRAAAAWAKLNERQQTYMRVLYDADQAAERHEKTVWTRGATRRPAEEWRWLDYGPVGNSLADPGMLQVLLAHHGVRDQGSGATLGALEGNGLIELHSDPALIGYHLHVRLTRFGRAVCRAAGMDTARPGTPGRGQLSEALWRMLAEVHAAGHDGLARRHVDGAWLRLTQREPEPYVAAEPAAEGYGYRLRLTPAGARHYADQWEAYARLYPQVSARRPDGSTPWPAEVDHALAVLGAQCRRLWRRREEALTESARLPTMAGRRVDGGELAAARNAAADAYNAALADAAERYRTVLDAHAEELAGMCRRECVRYAAAATAVVAATVAGADPAAAAEVDVDVEAVGWPWMPDAPVTGLAEIDAAVSQRWRHATGAPAPRRGRQRAAAAAAVLNSDGLEIRLADYAEYLAGLVKDGKLARLMLRAPEAKPLPGAAPLRDRAAVGRRARGQGDG